MAGSIPNVMTLNKPGGQNVVVTTQNLGTGQQMLPNVQILNMRPGTPTVTAQKSVAAVSPRVVIGAPQLVGARTAAPSITLQTLQSLQQGHQGHLLLKTENGQYQLLRVGPAPTASPLAAPGSQTIRLSTVPAHSGVAAGSTNVTAQGPISGQIQGHIAAPAVNATIAAAPQPQPQQQVQQPTTSTQVKPSDNTKEKCRNFLANLLDLSSKEPPSVEINVRNLIQELIDAQVEPEDFCDRLERLLNASPQPCLIGFLKKSLPLLRQSLVTKELVIEGINPPAPHVAFSTAQAQAPLPVVASATNIQMKLPQKPGGTIAVLQNIPVHTKINVSKVSTGKSLAMSSKASSSALSTVLTPGKSLLKEKEKPMTQFSSSHQYSDDKMAGDDDINDVAAMGGVNLAEETQRILGSTEMIGTQIRSCKDEYLVPLNVIQARMRAVTLKHGLEEPSSEVAALLSHAVHERLKTLVEKLAVIAQHRIDHVIKTDNRYEVTQDVKGQLKFLEELDRVDKKRREDSEREILLRAAKSRSKNEDPEQAQLKAKAKEMQRAELEELRQREANVTALQAIGPRKKPRLDGSAGGDNFPTGSSSGPGRSQLALRTRLKRINIRDMIFLLEQERDTAYSKSKKVKLEQLSCSNLRHLGAMVECARRPGVVAVIKVFHLDTNTKLIVDIVSDDGKTWTKVIARNPRSLSALSSGKASYGARSILDQAKDYLECAKAYPCMYQVPRVIFEFMSGIEENLANKLKSAGIIVKGDVLPDTHIDESDDESLSDSEYSDEEFDSKEPVCVVSNNLEDHPEITTLNLDVTAMMAYVSNMTNGHCNYAFKQKVLTEQCEWEAARPVKPVLEKLFQGKTLVCCKTAWDDFEKIVNTLGGVNEMRRSTELKKMLTIYPDDYAGEDDDIRKKLSVRGHVRQRSKIIFNFGHRIKAITVSANDGFVRAALQQGVTYAAFIHESRALTEGKEPTGQIIKIR